MDEYKSEIKNDLKFFHTGLQNDMRNLVAPFLERVIIAEKSNIENKKMIKDETKDRKKENKYIKGRVSKLENRIVVLEDLFKINTPIKDPKTNSDDKNELMIDLGATDVISIRKPQNGLEIIRLDDDTDLNDFPIIALNDDRMTENTDYNSKKYQLKESNCHPSLDRKIKKKLKENLPAKKKIKGKIKYLVKFQHLRKKYDYGTFDMKNDAKLEIQKLWKNGLYKN